MSEIKMKKITSKTFKERYKEDTKKQLPNGYIDFDDYKDLKDCIVGTEMIIKQKVKVTRISEDGIGYDIMEMGVKKNRLPRKYNN